MDSIFCTRDEQSDQLKALFLPSGLLFNDGVISGVFNTLLNNAIVFVYLGSEYVKIVFNGTNSNQFSLVVEGNEEDHDIRFPLTTLTLYSNLYSDSIELDESYRLPIVRVINLNASFLHFDETTRHLRYFCTIPSTVDDFVLITGRANSTHSLRLSFTKGGMRPYKRLSLRSIIRSWCL